MALKPATGIQFDASYSYTVVQVEQKLDGIGPDASQKTSPDGVALWTVDALRQGGEAAALVSVTVPSPSRPDVAGPAEFENLRAGLWLGERPKQGGIYWQADAVKPSGAKSSTSRGGDA